MAQIERWRQLSYMQVERAITLRGVREWRTGE